MSETEQIVAAALDALDKATHLDFLEKAKIAGKIEDMANAAWHKFMEQEEQATDRRWDAAVKQMGR